MIRLLLFVSLLFSVHISVQAQSRAQTQKTVNSAQYNWHAFLIAGDHSITNFDNGRKTLGRLFYNYGVPANRQYHFTSTQSELAKNVYPANLKTMAQAFAYLGRNESRRKACLIHMTSHGIRDGGFYLSREQSQRMTTTQFSQLVDRACGQQPTVILVSACFSGQFINRELMGPNRIIMTAAIYDRPSFGCSPDTTYTFWDKCVIDELPNSQTWTHLAVNVRSCIAKKEAEVGVRPSLPQAYIGKNMRRVRILRK